MMDMSSLGAAADTAAAAAVPLLLLQRLRRRRRPFVADAPQVDRQVALKRCCFEILT